MWTYSYDQGTFAALEKFGANALEQRLLGRQLSPAALTPAMADVTGALKRRSAIPGTQGERATGAYPQAVRNLRRESRSFVVPTPEELERTRRFHELALRPRMRDINIRTTPGANPGIALSAAAMRSPKRMTHTQPDDYRIEFDPTKLNRFTSQVRGSRSLFSGKGSQPKGVSAVFGRGALEHEVGELNRTRESLTGGRPLNPYGTHTGVEPDLRMIQAIHRDPEALSLFGRMRQDQGSAGERLFMKLYKQYGGTPNNPLPPTGRTARRLDERMGKALSQKRQDPTDRDAVDASIMRGENVADPLHQRWSRNYKRSL